MDHYGYFIGLPSTDVTSIEKSLGLGWLIKNIFFSFLTLTKWRERERERKRRDNEREGKFLKIKFMTSLN